MFHSTKNCYCTVRQFRLKGDVFCTVDPNNTGSRWYSYAYGQNTSEFQGKFYGQSDGMCHHGVAWNTTVIANNYMEHLYKTAMQTAPLQPTLCFRYVEDIFVIWQYGNISMSTLTSNTPNIQFTVEEKDRKLPFLDVQVTRSPKWLSTVFTESLPTQIRYMTRKT